MNQLVAKLVKTGRQKSMIQVQEDGKDKPTWLWCTKNAYKWTKDKYKEGDTLAIEFGEKDGQKFVTKVTREGEESTQSSYTPPADANANSYIPDPVGVSSINKKVAIDIIEENMTTAISNALISMQGHVTPQNVEELVNKLFAVYLKNVKKTLQELSVI